MSEVLPLAPYRRRTRAVPLGSLNKANRIFFNRAELNQILSLYSRRVIAGEWCDYAFELDEDGAVFAAYRRASPAPPYRIVKRAARGYLVTSGGRVLKYGRSLEMVLEVFDHQRLCAVDPA